MKGRALYHDFYEHQDHEKVAEFMMGASHRQRWIVSYDNVPAIRDLYERAPHVIYDIGYSARSISLGSEVMFFCDELKVPALIGPIKITEDHAGIFLRLA